MSKRQVVNELHKPARKNFQRRRVIIKGFDDLWQADLVEMGAYAELNKDFRYLLTVIDTFSKFAWAIPIKRKTGLEVTTAMQSIFNEGRSPQNLQTNDGKEFFNSAFQKRMKTYNINPYSTYSTLKASIVERWNRTLKTAMWKEFSMNGTYHWTNILKKLVNDYNKRKHSTIKMRPCDVTSNEEKHLLSTVYNHIKIIDRGRYKVGDFVRISKHKHVFEKGYTPNWTTEIFKIRKIQNTHPITYLLEDYKGNPIQGGFYELEISGVKYPDFYLVEKILKKQGDKVFVKWLGFPSNHNSWINKKDVEKSSF